MSKVKRISKKIDIKTGAFLIYMVLMFMFISTISSLFMGEYREFLLKLIVLFFLVFQQGL